MRIRLHPATVWAVGVIAAALVAPAAAQQRWGDLTGCELSAGGGRITASARCGSFEVPEDPERPDGRRIELAFAVAPALAAPADDPIVFLAGGPGQSARDILPIMKRALDDLNEHRDLIFLDQRGTGGSNALECDFGAAEGFLDPDFDKLVQRLRECKAGWRADVRHYTTADGADDVIALLDRHDIERANFYGGSYGTRMAQVILRRHPGRVRSIVLDGVVPMRLALGAEHGFKLDAALHKLFDACAADARCAEAFPDLDSAFEQLKRQYRENPVDLTITDPRTGVGTEVRFNKDTLAAGLRFLAYAPESQMMIPYLIHEAATTGDPSRLASQALIVTDQMAEQIAIGLNFAVSCSEDWPAWPEDSDPSGTLLGDSMTEMFARVCQWWPAGDVAADFHEPVESDVPALILSGELDPVTPPEYGAETAEHFPNSVHLVAPGRGHIVATNHCMSSIVTEFVRQASIDDLDTECIETLGREPFFLDLLGPAP